MIVPAVAVGDLDRARQFYGQQVGLPLQDETQFSLRFGCGAGTQLAVRRGTPNVGQTVAHIEVADIEGSIADLQSRGVTFDDY